MAPIKYSIVFGPRMVVVGGEVDGAVVVGGTVVGTVEGAVVTFFEELIVVVVGTVEVEVVGIVLL